MYIYFFLCAGQAILSRAGPFISESLSFIYQTEVVKMKIGVYSEAADLLKDSKRYGHRLRCSLIQGCIYDMFSKNMCKSPTRLKKLTHVISATRVRRSRDVGRLTVRYTPPNLCLDHAQNMFLFMHLCTTSTEERSKKSSPS